MVIKGVYFKYLAGNSNYNVERTETNTKQATSTPILFAIYVGLAGCSWSSSCNESNNYDRLIGYVLRVEVFFLRDSLVAFCVCILSLCVRACMCV